MLSNTLNIIEDQNQISIAQVINKQTNFNCNLDDGLKPLTWTRKTFSFVLSEIYLSLTQRISYVTFQPMKSQSKQPPLGSVESHDIYNILDEIEENEEKIEKEHHEQGHG